MSAHRWRPNATVAVVVALDDKFLMVEEIDPDTRARALNQPAGHLEENESLIDAAIREVQEETRWDVDITGYLGVARFIGSDGITYLRHSFLATPVIEVATRALDGGIIAAHWMSLGEIETAHIPLRSPQVLAVIKLYLSGAAAPLSLVLDI